MTRELPSNKAQRARILRNGMELARSYRNPQSVEWAMTYWYMQGIRNFHVSSYRDGLFKWSYETPEGEKAIRIEDTLKQYQRQLGLFQKIDVNPAITPKGEGLMSMQQAACGQVILDNAIQSVNLPAVWLEAAQLSLMYGNGGLVASVNPDVSFEGMMRPKLITVPPWHILPDPAKPTRREEVHGLFYHRWAPFKWIVANFKDRLTVPAITEEKLQLRRVALGDKIDNQDQDSQANVQTVRNRTMQYTDGQDLGATDDEPWVEVIEWWNFDENEKVCGYEVMLGDYIATKDSFRSYSNAKMPCLPVGWFGCQLSGGFWNRGWVPLMIPNNIEIEKMYSSLYQNAANQDALRWLAIANTMGITREDLTPVKGRPNAIFYEPDYSAPNAKPDMIEFRTSGDFPGRVAGSAIQIADRLGNASDLFNGKAPGRVDSASGLGLLYETVGIQNIPAAESFARAFTTVYRAFLQQARVLLSNKNLLPILSTDDDLVGVIMDKETGQMVFDENTPLPTPDEVNIGIRDKLPRMVEQMRQDAAAMRKMGQLQPEEFAWYCYKNKLGLPAGFEGEIEEIRKCKLRNRIQWGDGKKPRGVVPSALDNHALQMKYMKIFMSRPIFQYGDKNVRDAFEQRYKFHEAGLGGFPDGIPYPEDMEEQAAAQQQGPQWGAAGAMPPPDALPPQLAAMMQAPPEGEVPEGQQ